jgi:hypothetical protein
MNPTIACPNPRSTRRRLVGLVAIGTLTVAACGGGDDDAAPAGGGEELDDGAAADTDDLDTSGLDEGQQDLLDDATAGLEDEFDDDDDEESPAWNGIRLLTGTSGARLETLDAEAFSGVVEGYSVSVDDPIGNLVPGGRVIDNDVVIGNSLWLSTKSAVHEIALADGSITATISIDDVLTGGEFGDLTGDADGLYAIASLPGGADLLAEVDPAAGAVRSTIDLTNEVTSLFTIASNDTHVAAAYKDAPGIPVKLIERSSGTVTDVGDYLDLHEVQIVRDELWVIVGSGSVSQPATYERFGLDGAALGSGTLPAVGNVRVFGDRIVVVTSDNAADPSNPVAPIEVEPQGTPIEDFLPAGLVTLSGYAEIDGLAVSAGGCCLKDDGDFPLRAAVVDMATGEVVHTADSITATEILPAAEPLTDG